MVRKAEITEDQFDELHSKYIALIDQLAATERRHNEDQELIRRLRTALQTTVQEELELRIKILDELSRNCDVVAEVKRQNLTLTRQSYAQSATSLRSLLGLLYYRVRSPDLTADKIRAKARLHGLPQDDIENLVEMLVRLRPIVGLLWRKLIFRGATVKAIVGAQLRRKSQRQ